MVDEAAGCSRKALLMIWPDDAVVESDPAFGAVLDSNMASSNRNVEPYV